MISALRVTSALRLGVGISVVRVCVLWFLAYREWSHQQAIGLLPLILLLYPEGLLMPSGFRWTLGTAMMFSGFLVMGSFLIALVIAVAAAALRS